MKTNDSTHKILYLQHAEAFGGAERQATAVIPVLKDYGIDVTAFIGPNAVVGRWLEEEGFTNYRTSSSYPSGWSAHVARHLPILKFPSVMKQMHHLVAEAEVIIGEQKPKLIYASLTFAWLLGGILGKKHNLPVVWRMGGVYLSRFQRLFLHWVMHHWHPSALVANSELVAEMYRSMTNSPVHVIFNGINLQLFCPSQQKPLYRTEDLQTSYVVGFAGRLTAQKNIMGLLDCFARLKQYVPHATLLVAGEQSVHMKEMEERAIQLGVIDGIRFVGFVDDMPGFYSSCDSVILPSVSEGCPNVILEAMAMERPVIATAVGGVPEVVTNGVEGILVPPGDMEALARGVSQLALHPDVGQSMGLAGRRRVEREFTVEHAAERLSQVLGDYCGEDDGA